MYNRAKCVELSKEEYRFFKALLKLLGNYKRDEVPSYIVAELHKVYQRSKTHHHLRGPMCDRHIK